MATTQSLSSPTTELTNWESNEIPTIPSSFSFCLRINFILEKLHEEDWLPEALKDGISAITNTIYQKQLNEVLDSKSARALVKNLAAIALEHQVLVTKSITLAQIRTLALEMDGQRVAAKQANSGTA